MTRSDTTMRRAVAAAQVAADRTIILAALRIYVAQLAIAIADARRLGFDEGPALARWTAADTLRAEMEDGR